MRDIIKLRSFYTEYFKNVEKKIVPSTVLHSISMYLPTTSGEHININAVTRVRKYNRFYNNLYFIG